MSFSGIFGHQRQLETLRYGLTNGRLHHAYLFVGPVGVGKRTVALTLAKAIHCTEKNGDSCNECSNCARIQTSNHPDVRVVEPLPGKKEISIDQIREIQKELNFRSFSGGKKIAILDPATLINWSAQNALLKTLEEPPPQSVLILISPTAGGLLPTLRSRCLCVSFGPLPRDFVAQFLISRKGKTAQEAEFLAAMSMGSLAKAINMEQDVLLKNRQAWVEKLNSLSPGNYRAAAEMAEKLAVNREECLKFLEWAEGWCRDLTVICAAGNPQAAVNLDMAAQIQHLAAQYGLDRVLEIHSETSQATARIHRNVNRRMVLESLFFSIVGTR